MSRNISITITATLGEEHFAELEESAREKLDGLRGVNARAEAAGNSLPVINMPDFNQHRDQLIAQHLLQYVASNLGRTQVAYAQGYLEHALTIGARGCRVTSDNSPTKIAFAMQSHDIDIDAYFGEIPFTARGAEREAELVRKKAQEVENGLIGDNLPAAFLAALGLIAAGPIKIEPDDETALEAGDRQHRELMDSPAVVAAHAIQPKADPADDDGALGDGYGLDPIEDEDAPRPVDPRQQPLDGVAVADEGAEWAAGAERPSIESFREAVQTGGDSLRQRKSPLDVND